jgi:DNA-binding NarL/FixJ family response regulator
MMSQPALPAVDARSRESDTTVVLLDGQPLWLRALESVLEQHGIDTLKSTSAIPEAEQEVEILEPAALVLDPWLTDAELNGLDLIRRLRSDDRRLKIICLSEIEQRERIDTAFAAGADAYILKVADPHDLAQAIKNVCNELIVLAPSRAADTSTPDERHAPEQQRAQDILTNRELEILCVVAEGRTNGEIARRLWVTEQTVKFHLSNIYRKLDLTNRTEAARWAHQHHLADASG